MYAYMLISAQLPWSLTWVMQRSGQCKRKCPTFSFTKRPDTLSMILLQARTACLQMYWGLSPVRAERANMEVLGSVEYVSNVAALQLHICIFSKHRGELWSSQRVSIISKDSHCICFPFLWTVCWIFNKQTGVITWSRKSKPYKPGSRKKLSGVTNETKYGRKQYSENI